MQQKHVSHTWLDALSQLQYCTLPSDYSKHCSRYCSLWTATKADNTMNSCVNFRAGDSLRSYAMLSISKLKNWGPLWHPHKCAHTGWHVMVLVKACIRDLTCSALPAASTQVQVEVAPPICLGFVLNWHLRSPRLPLLKQNAAFAI